MARLRRRPYQARSKKVCRVCIKVKAEWLVSNQGYEGIYCTKCLKEKTKQFHQEGKEHLNHSLTGGELQARRTYWI